MSVFAVDFGSLASTVAITRNGGVDVITNEVSKRETSTFISFADQERHIGESGFDRAVRNLKNTVSGIKNLIGARVDDEFLASEKRFLTCGTTGDAEGRLKLQVTYLGEECELYPEQCLAMFLQQLRKYVNREATTDPKVPADVRDCVVTVPCYYTAEQRALVFQACEMAGVHAMSLINETTAAAIDYGIFRGSSLPETEAEAQVVAIVDIGYSCTTIAIAKFWKGAMKVLARHHDKEVSTREIDVILAKHFAGEVQKKYHVDVTENKRAQIRLRQGCEKLKFLLSANQSAPLNIENLMDIDVNINSFPRSHLEELVVPMIDKYRALVKKTLAAAGIEDGAALHGVEMIGGGCRIPIFKLSTQEEFNKQPGFTLNASESVARGAAITAAVFSPKFQVREYVVNELSEFPISLGYYDENATAVSEVPFLPQVNKVVQLLLTESSYYPKMLEVTVKRSDAFDVFLFYSGESDALKGATHGKYVIGQYAVGAPAKPSNGEVKIRVKIHASGMIAIEGATTQEVFEVEEVEEKKDPENPEKEAEKITTKKQKQRKLELTLTPTIGILGHSPATVAECTKAETTMHANDLQHMLTKEVKNELESYILDNRTRLSEGGLLVDFAKKDDCATFLKLANEYEEWLYDDGSDSTLDEYNVRLQRLTEIGAPALRRQRLSEDIPFEQKRFVEKAKAQKDIALAKIGKAAHITEEELQGAAAKCEEAIEWSEKELIAYQGKAKFEDSAITPASFDHKLREIEVAVRTVVNKKAPPPPKKEEEQETMFDGS